MLLINKPKENYVKIEIWLTCSTLLSALSSALDFCGGAPAPASPCAWPWPGVWACDLPWSWLGPLVWPWLFCSWLCFWGLFDCCEGDFPADLGVAFISEAVAVGNLSFSCWLCCDCGLLPPDKKHQRNCRTDARVKKSRTHNFVITNGLLQTFFVNRSIWSYLSSFSSCLLLAVQVAGLIVLDCPPFLLISLIQSSTFTLQYGAERYYKIWNLGFLKCYYNGLTKISLRISRSIITGRIIRVKCWFIWSKT